MFWIVEETNSLENSCGAVVYTVCNSKEKANLAADSSSYEFTDIYGPLTKDEVFKFSMGVPKT